jgi:hypothetical protein
MKPTFTRARVREKEVFTTYLFAHMFDLLLLLFFISYIYTITVILLFLYTLYMPVYTYTRMLSAVPVSCGTVFFLYITQDRLAIDAAADGQATFR